MKDLYRELLVKIGENPKREGLTGTPERAADAMEFLTRGYRQTLAEAVDGALFASDHSDMVVVRGIELYSLCEHHILPFFGTCHIGYLPNGKILGLSKAARIVDLFAQRLQVQERLTHEIAKALLDVTGAQGVGVVIEARHMCMMMRGVEKQHSSMRTSCMLGKFRENATTRGEFLQLIMKPE